MSAGLAVVFVVYTLLVVYWGPFIWLDDTLNRNFHVQSLWPVLTRVDRIGQASPLNWKFDRAVCLPLLGLVAVVTGWRRRTWRPLALALLTVGVENLLVSIPKFALERGRPLSGHSFFSNGDLYPSGHTANMVAYYGLCYYLVSHYSDISERGKRWLFRLVVALTVIMFATSLLLRWHWFSDLVAGLLVGGVVLSLITGIDALLPFTRHPERDSPAPETRVPAKAPEEPAMTRTAHRGARRYSVSHSPAVEDPRTH